MTLKAIIFITGKHINKIKMKKFCNVKTRDIKMNELYNKIKRRLNDINMTKFKKKPHK